MRAPGTRGTLRTTLLDAGALPLAALLAAAAWGCAAGPPPEQPPPAGSEVMTCPAREGTPPLAGDRIRLAGSLGAAALEVRPVRLGPVLSRRLMDRGWDLKRADREPGEPVLLVKSPATLRIPPVPCGEGGAHGTSRRSPADAWVRLASQDGKELADGMSLSVDAAGVAPVESDLQEGGREIWLRAPRPAGAAGGAIVITAERNSEVGLAGIQVPLGRIQIEVDHEYRDAIVASSIRRAAFRMIPPAGGRLRFSLGLAGEEAGSRSPGREAGWEFVVRAGPAGAAAEVFRERLIGGGSPQTPPWRERSVDLSRWEGEEIALVLEAEPAGDPRSLALWGSPVVEAARREGDPRPNILLVSLDTLRADRVGRVSHGHPLTPELARLGRDGTLFTGCHTQAPSTLYGHGALLTGLPPAGHGATTRSVLPPGVPYLPGILSRAGYATVALTDDGLLDGRYGFARGFDRFRSVSEAIEGKVDLALQALETVEGPWLLLFHSYTTHVPYSPPPEFASLFLEDYDGPLGGTIDARRIKKTVSWMNQGRLPVRPEDLRRLENLYDGEVRRADHALGRILRWLRDRGLYDSTIVVVTSDHGEELNEHGVVAWHALTCYEELMRVPLIVKPARIGEASPALPAASAAGPGSGETVGAPRGGPPGRAAVSATTVETVVRTIDIAPTILELAGLDPHAAMMGRPLTGLMAGRSEPDRPATCEVEDARGAAILHEGWKYHMRADWSVDDPRTPRRRLQQRGKYGAEELYDLSADPGEQVNVARAHPERARELRAMLQRKLREATTVQASLTRDDPAARVPQEDAEHLERLRALGYVD